MVNVKTMRGLHQALTDCVPGKAQRHRLLHALARVPGNKVVTEMMNWLITLEWSGSTQRVSPSPAPDSFKHVFRTQLITYTQSASEVQVTMSKATAEDLLRSLDRPDDRGLDEALTLPLQRALRSTLRGGHVAP